MDFEEIWHTSRHYSLLEVVNFGTPASGKVVLQGVKNFD